MKLSFLLSLIISLSGCKAPWEENVIELDNSNATIPKTSQDDESSSNDNSNAIAKAVISNVSIVNNQLVVNGSKMDSVSKIKVEGPGVNETFIKESGSSTSFIGNAGAAVAFAIGQVFNLIVTDAHGAATFQVTFTLSNDSVTTDKILDGEVKTADIEDGAITKEKLDTAVAQDGEVLMFQGGAWTYQNINGLSY